MGSETEDTGSSTEASERYRSSVYEKIDYNSLDRSKDGTDHPQSDSGSYRIADLPEVPRVRDMVGPSAITLAAGLGSGAALFWPSLASQTGWTLYWAFWVAVVGIFFLNTELQRWSIATGETIFRGFQRLNNLWL